LDQHSVQSNCFLAGEQDIGRIDDDLEEEELFTLQLLAQHLDKIAQDLPEALQF